MDTRANQNAKHQMTFKRVLAESKLTQVELAKLYGVSKPMIWYWSKHGEPLYSTHARRQAALITTALCVGVDHGKLPLRAMSKEARAKWVEKMAGTLQALKPAVH